MFSNCCGPDGCCASCGRENGSCYCQQRQRGVAPIEITSATHPIYMTPASAVEFPRGGATTPGGRIIAPGTPRSGMATVSYRPQSVSTSEGLQADTLRGGELHVPHAHLHGTASSIRSQTVDEKADRSRATEVNRQTDRQWVAVTAYQPIDTVVKTVEVPVIRTVETYVPKTTVEKKIIEVPKYVHEYVDKIVEVPEVQVQEKIVEEIEYQYQYKYVPKIEIKENIIQRPRIEKKYIEKIIHVPEIKEVVRYQPVETIEEVYRYVPKGQGIPDEWAKKEEEEPAPSVPSTQPPSPVGKPLPVTTAPEPGLGRYPIPTVPFETYPGLIGVTPPEVQAPQIDQVFKPKVVQTVEIQKQVPVAVEVPVPYMVPKPIVVPVQVPVLKFRDHFVPVPIRRRVIPRIRWTSEVYEVECIKQKPFLQIQDVIKPVPCSVEIKVHEFVDKACPCNPAELSQADIHAMWMRVNADLAEKRKEELGDKYPYVQHPPGTVFGEPGCSKEEEASRKEDTEKDPEAKKAEGEEGDKEGKRKDELEPIALHPGHPLAMTYLQNQWIKKDTTATHQMYTPEWFEAHQKALHNMTMQHPTQIQLTAEQAASLHPGSQQAFGEAPWLQTDSSGLPISPDLHHPREERRCCQSNCTNSNCCGCGGEPNPDAACCTSC